MSNDEKATIPGCKCIYSSDKAPKVCLGPKHRSKVIWVPKAAVHDDSDVFSSKAPDDTGKLVLKGWFAEKIGIDLD